MVSQYHECVLTTTAVTHDLYVIASCTLFGNYSFAWNLQLLPSDYTF